MKLTLQIKLLPDKNQSQSLLETIKKCNSICNEISNSAWERKTYNQYKLHHIVYHPIRKSSKIAAQALVRCISKVVDSYKLDKKTKRFFRLLGAITYDDRILSYNDKIASIWSVNGRLKIPFVCHNTNYLPHIKGEADLIVRGGKFYLFQTVEIPEDNVRDVEEFIGVDFGMVNLATTSNDLSYSGKDVNRVMQRTTRIKSILQKKNSKSAKKHLKKLSGTERRFKRQTNHVISKRIVSLAKDTNKGIALEDLKGFKATVRREQREKFTKWAFNELGEFITYKAKLAGVPVIFIDPRDTSKTCNKCGYISRNNRRSQSKFICRQCGFSLNADLNGAMNIASRASVNKPIAVYVQSRTASHKN